VAELPFAPEPALATAGVCPALLTVVLGVELPQPANASAAASTELVVFKLVVFSFTVVSICTDRGLRTGGFPAVRVYGGRGRRTGGLPQAPACVELRAEVRHR
jgi:hypothetical protein